MATKKEPAWKGLMTHWQRRYAEVHGTMYCTQGAKDSAVLKALLSQFDGEAIKGTMELMLTTRDAWLSTHREVRYLQTSWNKLHQEQQAVQGGRLTTMRALDRMQGGGA